MAPPVKLKQSSSSATKQTIATSSQDARLLVRETMRISANLASAPSAPSPTSIVSTIPPTVSRTAVSNPSITQSEFVDSSFRLICCEEVDGRRWNYFAEDVGGGVGSVVYSRNSIRAVSLQSPQAPIEEFLALYDLM